MDTVTTPPTHDLVAGMRQFIIDQAEGRTDETRQRYVQVADDLAVFMAEVDVGPWLGPELAAHLAEQRTVHGGDALVRSLGVASLIRVLPAFVDRAWMPPPGAQRRTQRTVVRRLLPFLRRAAHDAGCLSRNDFTVLDRSLGHSYSSFDADPVPTREGMVTCTVTVDLVEHLVDRLLEDVTEGRADSFDEAVAARLNPVKVTVWREPGYDRYGEGW